MPQASASEIFVARLKAARALRGVSQRALGVLLGLDRGTGSTRINRYERLAARPDLETSAQIARALGVPLAFLVADRDDLADLILAFDQLEPRDRASVITQVRQLVASKVR